MTDAPPGSEPYRLGQILWNYLRVAARPGPFPGSAEDTLILVLGSPDMTVADQAADLLDRGIANQAVVSGGCRAPGWGDRLEADVIADLIAARGIARERIILERKSQHTSDHFWKTEELLADTKLIGGGVNPPKFVVLIPAPVAERRALATGKRRWRTSEFRIDGVPISYAQYMGVGDHRELLGRMVGEVERIKCYPDLEYMYEPDPPPGENVLAAYEQLRADFNNRPAPFRRACP